MSNKNYESHRKAIVSKGIPPALLNRLTNSDVQVINTFLTLYGLDNFRISSKDNAAYQAFRMASAKLLNLE